jgi:outer membrane protein TolC
MNYALPSLAPMEPLGMTQLQLMQMLPLGGKLRASRRAAEYTAAAAGERADEALLEARADAAMAFFDLAAADRSLAVMRESIRLLADIERTVSSMYRVGESRQADVLRAQVELARMAEDTLRMQAMRVAMAGTLAALVDAPADSALGTAVVPAFPSAVPSLDSLLALAMARRPMLRAMARELAAAGARADLARKELVPDLTVGVQYGQRRAPADAMAGEGRGTERMGSLMLGASLPVFATSRQLPMRQEMEAMQAMARADLADARATTRGRLVQALASLDRARRLHALYAATILPQAEAAVASSLAAYRVGQVDFMTLLDNRMAANRFRTELASLAAEEGKAWAELEMLTATALVERDGGAR